MNTEQRFKKYLTVKTDIKSKINLPLLSLPVFMGKYFFRCPESLAAFQGLTRSQPGLFCGGRRQYATRAYQVEHWILYPLGLCPVHVMHRREGWWDNHKRIYRLYSKQGMSLHLKRPSRNKLAQLQQPQPHGRYPNHVWWSVWARICAQ